VMILCLAWACSDDKAKGPDLCNSDADCNGNQICVNGACRDECTTDDDCLQGQKCIDGACVVPCSDDGDCPVGETCQNGECVPAACIDLDGDGYGVNCEKGGDCDDSDDRTYPGAEELCDGKDNDCDQQSDSGIMCGAECCAAGEMCLDGECVADHGDCVDDGDCQEDSYCHEGRCIPYGEGPRGETNPDCTRLIVAGLFQPALQCEWVGPESGEFLNHLQVLGTPTVADFDFDGDPERVRPSIVFNTYDALDGDSGVQTDDDGVIRIIDGATCATQFSLGPHLNGCNPVAIGDLDGAADGRPEIVAHLNTGGVIAYKYDEGNQQWQVLWTGHDSGGAPVVFSEGSTSWGGPSLVDLDDDVSPEVLSGGLVYDATGLLLDDSLGLSVLHRVGFPVATDLEDDGLVELVGGNAVWEFDPLGKQWVAEWSTADGSGYTAVADFGSYSSDPGADDRATLDGIAEIAVVASGQARIDTAGGRTVFGPVNLPASSGGGPPTIGDFDGDGRAELAAAASDSMTIFDPDCVDPPEEEFCPTLQSGGILWTQPSQDHSSNITGSSLFDFEGDGVVEAVYADECFVRVYRGTDGTVLYSQWRSSCTWNENPIVADVDGDFSSELVVPSNQSCGTAPQNMGATSYETSPHGNPMDPLFTGLPCEDSTDCSSSNCDSGYCRCSGDDECPGGGFVCAPPPAGTPGSGNTCRAEWLGSVNGVRVYRDSLDRWVGSRTIWNQHAYAITNVSENGVVPSTSAADLNWQVPGLNNFRQNIQGDLNPDNSPDRTAGGGSFNTHCDDDNNLTMTVRVCNRGTNPFAAGGQVGFFDGDPDQGGVRVCTAETTTDLFPGECEEISCVWDDAPVDDPHDVYVLADPDSDRTECIETNNRAVIEGVTCEGYVP